METVEIKGLEEMRRALQRIIPAEMQGKVLQKALAPGASLTVRQAKLNAPKRTGVLRRAIYAARDRYNSRPTFEARVITVRRGKKAQKANRDAYYWKFVEFGHRIGTRKTGWLRKAGRASGGSTAVGGFVPAQPFLRPAFESTKNAAAQAITERLRMLLNDAARKARW